MPADLEFTGERFIPGTPGEIAYEHGHRYAFALRHVHGCRVLDAACGEGYGTGLLASAAREVVGIDISSDAVAHAITTYAALGNARFEQGSVTELPLTDHSVDVVVSFETIEHLPKAEQPRMLAEFARVLTDDGVLVLSSPNRARYSDARDYRNPFHLHELYREDLGALLDVGFPARQWFHQAPLLASAVWATEQCEAAEAWIGDGRSAQAATSPEAMYYIVVAAKHVRALPAPGPKLSIFHDRGESELDRVAAAHAEVLRLDRLLRERDVSLEEQGSRMRDLEERISYRERIIVERDAQLAAVAGAHQASLDALASEHQASLGAAYLAAAETRTAVERELETLRVHHAALAARLAEAEAQRIRSDAVVVAQERIIDYRQTLRWWLQLPWVRARSWWQYRIEP
ncbi:MAG: class I SAM-dependent methyltransferase [Casimicrobiaceae bacterium]